MKPKKYEEVKILQDKTLNEIKRDFKAQTIITAILVILALIICFMAWDTAVKYEALKKDKKALGRRITYCNELEKDLFENCNNYVISKQKIKDKIEELKEDKDSKYYDIFLEERDIENTIKILQELLDNRK